ncbi:MAG: hypothetical protein U9Q92_05585, partial [archaeon]|nr:hypothetical protein [archaeon]
MKRIEKYIEDFTLILRKFGIILVLLFLGVYGYVLYKWMIIFDVPKEILLRYFGSTEVLYIMVSGIMIFVFLCMLSQFFFTLCRVLGRKPNKWLWLTIITMIFFLYEGIILIGYELGNQDIKLALRDNDNNSKIVGDISCFDNDGVVLIGDSIECSMYPGLLDLNARVRFVLHNGSVIEKNISNLEFYAIPDVHQMSFSFNGVDSNGKQRHFSTDTFYHFWT